MHCLRFLLCILQCRPYFSAAFDYKLFELERRAVLKKLLVGASSFATISAPSSSLAVDDNGELSIAQPLGPPVAAADGTTAGGYPPSRPSAPLEYLLPAARVGTYIYQLLAIAETLDRTTKATDKGATNLLVQLDRMFLSPPSFVQMVDPKVSRGDPYDNKLPIIGEMGVAAQKQKERRENSIEAGVATQVIEVGQLIGERRQWNQLQKAERQREGASEVRRAFNIYTTNLNYNPSKYEWKGSKEEKSRRIRSDQMPTTTEVIRSDLDARDLYRNQVQTALEDAKAEYLFQKKRIVSQNGDNNKAFETEDLLELLKQAQASVDKWFSFIPDRDVQAALEAVMREQQQA